MLDTLGKLWIQTRNATILFDTTFCACLHSLYSKSTGRMLTFSISNDCSNIGDTALILGMSIFCVRAGCKIWMARYSSEHASQSLSDKSLSDKTLYKYTVILYIHCYLVRNYTWQHNSRTLSLHTCTTHQMAALLPTKHRFVRTKLASCYTTCCNFK